MGACGRFLSGLAAPAGLVVLLSAPAAGQVPAERSKAPPEMKSGQACTDCHGDLLRRAVVHPPARDAACEACHEQQGEKHAFEDTEERTKLCATCHEDIAAGAVVHEPAGKGLCLACHDPHGSAEKKLLRTAQPALCARCHEKEGKLDQAFVHGPVAQDGCTACHKPHAAAKAKLLEKEGRAVCLECHDEPAAGVADAQKHPPFREDCVQCHSPHQSPNRYQLVASPPALCLECHDDLKGEIEKAKVPHKALAAERSCLACHDPHGQPAPKLLRAKDAGELCLGCHKKMADHLAANPNAHKPVRDRDCVACHKPHGGGFALLKAGFPEGIYAAFAPDAYGLCFSCHPKELALEAKTTKATAFRDGDRNLHHLHVNREKGRTCRACHDPHATVGPKQVRASFAFGAWDAPVRYEKRDTGGACAPACHVRKEYDRGAGRP